MPVLESRPPKRSSAGHKYYWLPSLQHLRETQGLSRQQLAERAGVTRVTIYHIESDKHMAGVETVYRLAQGLGVPPMDLVLVPPVQEADEET